MSGKNRSQNSFEALRKRAEQLVNARDVNAENGHEADFLRLLHEVEVQNVELQLQNEELRGVTKQLKNSRDEFADLHQYAPVAIITLDEKCIIKHFNESAARMFSDPKKNYPGRPFSSLVTPEDRKAFYSYITNAASNPSPAYSELRLTGGKGRLIHVQLSARAKYDSKGGVCQWQFFMVDITERKQAEEALRLTQASVDVAAEMIAWFTPDGSICYVNDATCRNLGYSRDELLKMTALDFSPGFTWEQYRQHWQEVRERKSFTLETTHRRKDGSEYFAEVLVNHVVYIGQEYIFAYGRDITDRKRAEEALQASQTEMLQAQRVAHIGSWTWDARTDKGTASDELLRIYGFEPARQTIPAFADQCGLWYPPEEWDRLNAAVQESAGTGGGYDLEVQALRNGRRIWVQTRSEAIRDAEGRIVGLRGTVQDITSRKQTEVALQAALTRAEEGDRMLKALMEYVPEGITIADRQLNLKMVSRQGQDLLGMHQGMPTEEVAKRWKIYGSDGTTPMPDEDLPMVRAVRHGAIVKNVELIQMNDRGQKLPLLCNAAPIRDSAARIVGGIVAWRDISDLKKAKEALKASLAEKEVLLQEIHHRVKNNMQVISSLVDLQANEVREPAMRLIFQDIVYRVRSMAMVHEKLYQSADFARVDFADYAKSLLNYLWRAHETASGIRLELDVQPILLPINTAIPCGLILNELVSNALRHAFRDRENGRVAVSLHVDENGRVGLSVGDNGTGLPPGFEWRTATSLGLRLVQMLCGQIHADVAVAGSAGTKFTITYEISEA